MFRWPRVSWILLGLLGLASPTRSFAEAWTLGGYHVETFQQGTDPLQDGVGLRFSRSGGSIAAEIRGDGAGEMWRVLKGPFLIEGHPDPLVAFWHFSGGTHCCSDLRIVSLGAQPSIFATTPEMDSPDPALIETPSGWIAPWQDIGFNYAFGRGFGDSPPIYLRLTPTGFQPAPEMQVLGPDGLPALYALCRSKGKGDDGRPTCGGFGFTAADDVRLLSGIDDAVTSGAGDAAKVLLNIPSAAFDRVAEGRAALVLDRLAVAAAPPAVARTLVQAFALRPYWPEMLKLNGSEVLFAPFVSEMPALAGLKGRDPRPLSRFGGRLVGIATMDCATGDASMLRLFDRYGGELGSAAVEGCPRLFSPLPLDDAHGGAALIVAGDEQAVSLVAAVTPGGGMVLPVDSPGVVVRTAETDGEGRVLSITLGRDAAGGGGESKVCRLTDVPSSLACIDGF